MTVVKLISVNYETMLAGSLVPGTGARCAAALAVDGRQRVQRYAM
jgi:hypothetical protein